MPLSIDKIQGKIHVNGQAHPPGSPLPRPGRQPPQLQVHPGAQCEVVSATQGKALHLDYSNPKELKFTAAFPPVLYLSRRRSQPAVYDVQTVDGRLLLVEESNTSRPSTSPSAAA